MRSTCAGIVMPVHETQPIMLKKSEYDVILRLLESNTMELSPCTERLMDEIDLAEIVDSHTGFPTNIVSIHSCVEYKNLNTGEHRTIEIVYPREANIFENRVSVLSPIGSALLGLKVGDVTLWPLPKQKTVRLEVISVRQPQ